MKTSGIRSYNCKDEELPVICRYALPYLKRDLADFATFSPVFNDDYVEKFTAKINLVDELVLPNIEINELKKITKRLYLTMDSVLDPVAKIRAYLRLAKNTVDVSAKEYVFSSLKKSVRNTRQQCADING